jgi:hypothetical protein
VFRSYDGSNWTMVNTGLTNTNVSSLVISGTNMFAATYDCCVFLSTDNGNSWKAVNAGMPTMDVLSLSISGNTLYAGTETGLWRRSIFDITDISEQVNTLVSHLYPNPGNGVFAIDNTENLHSIIIRNHLGKMVYNTQDLKYGLNEIDLKHLSKGIYYATVLQDDRSYTEKVVIE